MDDVDGVPVLRHAPRYLVGSIIERATWGDHMGILLDVDRPVVRRSAAVLMFQQVRDLEPGHEA